jgi:hypothetical protein
MYISRCKDHQEKRLGWTEFELLEGIRNACRILVAKPEGRRPLARPKQKLETNTDMGLETNMGERGITLLGFD